ncbi:MAG: DUF3592 domain-containing protein [Enhydrobacter sp.]|nr:MAG: DUF3592 domain-containing protein [Enhydrobacter sp.]
MASIADPTWRRISWLILGIGSLIVAGGLALGWGSLRLVLYGDRADGRVVEMVREDDMYAPVVQFRQRDGTLLQVTDLGNGVPDFAVGDRVTVFYAPDDPGRFRLDTFGRLWESAVLLAGFGCFWLIFGGIAWGLSTGADLPVLGERAFAFIAAAAGLVGILATWNALSLYAGGTHTEGVVVEIRESRSVERETSVSSTGRETSRSVERTTHTPIIRFRTQQDREIEFFGRGGTGASFEVGERVPVVYDPADPMHAHIVSFANLWLPAAICWAIVLLFGGAVWLSRRSRRAAPT